MAPKDVNVSHPEALAHLEKCLEKMLCVHVRMLREAMEKGWPSEVAFIAAQELVALAKQKITDKVVITVRPESANIPVPSLN